MSVRVRFAPSPTGYLHIGGARTALFNWLYARHHGGAFILRIEDTDTTRSTEEFISAIIDGMQWLGLDWDEGPYRQTERFEIYRAHVRRLLQDGSAYYCYCSPEELEERRQAAMRSGLPMRYDRRCRQGGEAPSGVEPVVRFKMPTDGTTVVRDVIRGSIEYDNATLDDLIILRSDGTPTYNFVVVVDDVEMRVTHVIRGDDHLNNTPKQIHIYRALGYEIPVFSHLPMILGADKTRLSKRHGATSVQAYRDMGYLPEALLNYLVRLGWAYGDQEIFTKGELVEKFSLESVGKAAAVFNPEKLLWLNAQYLKRIPDGELAERVKPSLAECGVSLEGLAVGGEWLARAVGMLKERVKTLTELALALRLYLGEEVEYEERAAGKFLTEGTVPYLRDLREGMAALGTFDHDHIEGVFRSATERHGVKMRDIAQPVRVALTGGTESPGIFDVIEVLGRDKVLRRIDAAIQRIDSSRSS